MHNNLLLVHSPLALQTIFLGPNMGVYPGLQPRATSSPGPKNLCRPSSWILAPSSGLLHTGTTNRLRNRVQTFTSCWPHISGNKCLLLKRLYDRYHSNVTLIISLELIRARSLHCFHSTFPKSPIYFLHCLQFLKCFAVEMNFFCNVTWESFYCFDSH